jgi:hypothetical protein
MGSEPSDAHICLLGSHYLHGLWYANSLSSKAGQCTSSSPWTLCERGCTGVWRLLVSASFTSLTSIIQTSNMYNAHLRVMDPETTAFAVWRQRACSGLLETFDDGGFTSPIVANNKSKGLLKIHSNGVVGVEAANPLDFQPFECAHPVLCCAALSQDRVA